MPGVNDDHVEVVAEEMRALGADMMNCIPLYPVAGTPVCGDWRAAALRRSSRSAPRFPSCIPQMEHCTRCRADAVGLLGADQSSELVSLMRDSANGLLDDRSGRPYVAVASMEGILINQHLGEAESSGSSSTTRSSRSWWRCATLPERGRRQSALARTGKVDRGLPLDPGQRSGTGSRAGCWNRAACE